MRVWNSEECDYQWDYVYPLTKQGIIDFVMRDDVIISDEYGDVQDPGEFLDMAFNWCKDGIDGKEYQTNPKYNAYPYYPDNERNNFWRALGYEPEYYDFYSDGLRFSTSIEFSYLLDHFVVYDGDEDVTEELLSHEGYLFLFFSEDLTRANDDDINVIHELYDYAQEYGYPFYAITASSPREITEWCDNSGAEYPFYYMDRTTIRTIQRANPFLMIIKDGVIYHKYYISQLPDEDLLVAPVEEISAYATMPRYNAPYRVLFLSALFILPIMLLYFTERIALFALRRFRRWREARKQSQENI